MSLRRLAIFPTKAVAASARQTLNGGAAVGCHHSYDPLGCQRRFNSDKKLPGCLGGVGGDIPPIASPPPSKAEGPSPTATLPTAQHYINTNKVIADVSEGAVDPELAADIATTLMFSDPLKRVRFAAKVLRGADHLKLREELYLEQVVAVLSESVTKDIVPPPDFQKEVVPCVHTGQLVWDRLGAYTVLRLEQKGIISLGHKGIINAAGDERIDDELLALANVLNDVTSLNISRNTGKSITTCEPFAGTLVELNAEHSAMTDEGLKLCTKLRKVNLSHTKGVTSCAPFADTLEELDDRYGSGITNASLKCCRKIRKLSIRWNSNITTCEPFAGTLVELNAEHSAMTDEGLKLCTKLRKVNLSHTKGVTSCAPFSDTLEELVVCGDCGLTSNVIQHCTKLRKLDVSGNLKVRTCDSLKDLEELTASEGFTTSSLQKVAKQCHRLKYLKLSLQCADVVTDGLIKKFAKNCRDLLYVDISYTKPTTDSSIIALATNCPQLRCLVVEACEGITDAAIIKVAKNCPDLEELDVSWTSKITDTSIKRVAAKCPRLRKLNVRGTEGRITDASMLEIATKCPQLRCLVVRSVEAITDKAIIKVAENCPNLEELDVSDTSNITDASINIVAAKCPKLRELDVDGTEGRITNASIVKIAKNCPLVKYINNYATGGEVAVNLPSILAY